MGTFRLSTVRLMPWETPQGADLGHCSHQYLSFQQAQVHEVLWLVTVPTGIRCKGLFQTVQVEFKAVVLQRVL